MSIQKTVTTFENCKSLDELKSELARAARGYGFSGFEFLDIGSSEYNLSCYQGNSAKSWEDDYSPAQYQKVDPCLAHARRTDTPFTWSQMELPHTPNTSNYPEMDIMEAAQLQVAEKGLIIPYHFVDPVGRIYSNLVAFSWKDNLADFRTILKERQVELHVLMVYWAQCAMDLVAPELTQGLISENTSARPKASPLNNQEVDFLSWSALGKTNEEISELMKLPLADIRNITGSALKKLEASNKTHAISKAIYLGLIQI